MTTTRFSVLLSEPIATIAPTLHGQFTEHLGELVYPGLWVGPDSAVPNVNGLRTDVIDALTPLGIPVLRWPGGCFADDYHWRDGIGPRADRPRRLNVHWDMAPEPNEFGTHEFLQLAGLLGATPYLAGNLGSGTAAELRDWIEYCNHPSGTTLSDERRANGAEEPFAVTWWGVGNENWGCGGSMTPEHYAEEYCRFETFALPFGGTRLSTVACGPAGNDWAWTRRFFTQIERGTLGSRLHRVTNFAAHYYCGTAGTATKYTESQWLELLTKAAAVEGIVTGHRAIMDEFDPDRKIGLILDEWGTWHPVEEGKAPHSLYQQNTIRDACVAGLSLDVFHNHADKLVMTNIAQLVNVLQSMLLVDETRCVTTPTYHVFALYAAHQGQQAIRTFSDADVISHGEESAESVRRSWSDGRQGELRRVSGSASVLDDHLVVTLVNAHPTEACDVVLDLHGGQLGTAEAVTLAADDIHAHNTFDEPDAVRPGPAYSVVVDADAVRLRLPAGSVTRVIGTLQG